MENSIRFQRNLLIGMAILLFAINSLLTVCLFIRDEMVVMVPTIERELRVSRDFVSDEYLRLRAEQFMYLLFSMREGNVEYITRELLKGIDAAKSNEFKVQIEKLGQDIEQRKYRYWFTDLQEIEIDNYNLNVVLSGYLETYLADKQIDKHFKKYLLTFKNRNGLVKLETFMEIKDEKDK
jgi:type IV conjugative transfer system protein TraE